MLHGRKIHYEQLLSDHPASIYVRDRNRRRSLGHILGSASTNIIAQLAKPFQQIGHVNAT
jgi:hypothetical protein